MIQNWLIKIFIWRKIKNGFGPFTNDSLFAFVNCECQNCKSNLSEFTLFGNALVVSAKNEVKVLCSQCRIGKEQQSFNIKSYHAKTTDKILILCKLYFFLSNRKILLSWYDIVICLRFNIYPFQNSNDSDLFIKAFSKTNRDKALWEFNSPLPCNCAECGAVWAHNFKVYYSSKEIQNLIDNDPSKENCRACGFPTKHQWFRRETIESEKNKMYK